MTIKQLAALVACLLAVSAVRAGQSVPANNIAGRAEDPRDARIRELTATVNLLESKLARQEAEIKELKAKLRDRSPKDKLDRTIDLLKSKMETTTRPSDANAAFIGVSVANMGQDFLEAFEKDGILAPRGPGVIVVSVAQTSPAHRAGIKRLDVIEGVGPARISDIATFQSATRTLKIGQPCRISVNRMTGKNTRGKIGWARQIIRVVPKSRAEGLIAAKHCPLKMISARLGFNVIGQPTVRLIVENVSPLRVVAYSVIIECFDRFDRPVQHWASGSNRFGGISQRTIALGATTGQSSHWTLHGHDNTARIKVLLTKVRLEDGTEWLPSVGEELYVEAESAK